ncbi:carboxylesterase [Stachybotrys elegans]|uniref:Carboxylic ester hydrolase n=1 Tax=Stachybotrys elegans TaxID=80388 RepID=A0A8K0WRH2_9HYPO|nr:carboxylesterase [Stachybotrys elegans]
MDIWLCLGLATQGTSGLDTSSHVGCVVELSNGVRIFGRPSALQPGVCEFLGIPYALAPVGDLRFAPPQAAVLERDIVADDYGPDCPQNPSRLFVYPGATPQYAQVFSNFVSTTSTNRTQSEDCLTLNVWARADSLRVHVPVLAWIHGGRHNSGSAHTPFYDGANFVAAENAIFVTFNFRMNIFGFPGSPGHQNLGFLDQYLAVQWVSDNIKHFGGNPRQISLYGQSSGAVATSNWAYAFKDKPLVAGTASHSGNHFSFPANAMGTASANWYRVSATVGCGSSGDNLACMRNHNITFQAILDAVRLVPPVPGNSVARSQPPFQATVDNKTFWSTPEYIRRARNGDLARLPFLQISGDHESGFYRISALAQGNTLPESDWDKFERESFTCAAAAEAYYRSLHGITTYRFRYMADWFNTRLYENPSSGAYHGVEIGTITGNSALVSGISPGSVQTTLGGIMSNRWWWFAADAKNGLTQTFGWPKYAAGQKTLGLVGAGNTSIIEFADPNMYDSQCYGDNLEYWDSRIPSI